MKNMNLMNLETQKKNPIFRSVDKAIRGMVPDEFVCRSCVLYNILGIEAIRVMTGEIAIPVLVSLRLITDPSPADGGRPYALEYDIKNPFEFHCICLHKEPSTEDLTFIDFSFKHFEAHAKLQGIPWNREPLPDYLWTNLQDDEHGIGCLDLWMGTDQKWSVETLKRFLEENKQLIALCKLFLGEFLKEELKLA